MTKQLKPVDISDVPQLLDLIEEMRRTRQTLLLRQDDEDLAIVTPVRRTTESPRRRKTFGADDPLWRIVGLDRSNHSDVSTDKYRYLAEAYRLDDRT